MKALCAGVSRLVMVMGAETAVHTITRMRPLLASSPSCEILHVGIWDLRHGKILPLQTKQKFHPSNQMKGSLSSADTLFPCKGFYCIAFSYQDALLGHISNPLASVSLVP